MDIGSLTGQIVLEDQLSGALNNASKSVTDFAKEYDGLVGGMALGSAAIIAAVGAVTGAIIALGNRGADVNDVRDTFEKFSGSAENAADTLKQMQDGVKNTVTDFDLMKASSKLLAADVKLTADQFGTLSKASFVLQNQGLGDTKEMMDLLSQAMLTGRTRSLEMKIGKIDLTKATQDYAKSLGVEVADLTNAQELEIKRAGILDTLNKKVKEAGDQQRDFGETMEAAIIWIKNWGDELSSRVAESPRVMAAVHNIETAIQKAFGGESKTIMDLAVGTIENIADIVARDGPKIIQFGSDVVAKFKEWYDWAVKIRTELENLQKFMKYLGPNAMANMWKDATGTDQSPVGDWKPPAWEGVTPSVPPPAPVVKPPTTPDIAEETKSAKAYRLAIKALQDDLFGNTAIEGAKKYTTALKDMSNLHKLNAEQVTTVHEAVSEGIAAYERQGRVAPLAMKNLYVATAQAIPSVVGLGKEFENLGKKIAVSMPIYVIDGLGKSIEGLGKTFDAAEGYADMYAKNWKQRDDDMRNNSRTTLLNIAKDAQETYRRMEANPAEYSKATRRHFKQIAEDAMHAAEGTKSAWQQTYDALGNIATILDNISGKFAEVGAMAARTAISAMEAFAKQDYIGMAVSIATGAAAILQKLFGGVSKAVQEARDAVDKFGDSLSDSLTEAQKLEAGGVKWKETVIAVRDAYLLVGRTASEAENVVSRLWDTSNPARSKAAQKEIEINMALAKNISSVRTLVQEYLGAGKTIPAALQANIDKLVRMGQLTAENAAAMLDLKDKAVPSYDDVKAAAERYGIVVETLGNAVQGLQVTEIANQMIADWELMELAGADMTVVMQGMRDEVLKLITDAAKFGTALPAAMKPIIARMDEAGYFTDEFGNKLVDVSQLTFAETLEEKITRIVDAMLLLADVITNKVGGALDDIGNRTYNPRINPRYEGPSAPADPEYMAGGGKVLAWRPRGSDTVPAMLTPGETVTPKGGVAPGQGGGTVIIEIDKRQIAEIVVPEMPRVLARYRLGR